MPEPMQYQVCGAKDCICLSVGGEKRLIFQPVEDFLEFVAFTNNFHRRIVGKAEETRILSKEEVMEELNQTLKRFQKGEGTCHN